MKVRKTSTSTAVTKVGYARATDKKAGSQDVEQVDVADTVNLSAEAIAAAKVESTDGVDASGEALPDAYETSRAMLEKELARVFREVYL